MSRLLTVTFTTAAFARSSSRLFEASSYQTASKGLPPSFAQHDAFASSRHTAAPKPVPFGSATWQSSFDSSKVWAQAQHAIPPDANTVSCPNTGSIACVLLQVIGAENGPAGGKFLTQTSFIQRLNTNGGSAPATGCSVSTDVGRQALVPYTADYFFYRNNQ
jgi:hypothetical protein